MKDRTTSGAFLQGREAKRKPNAGSFLLLLVIILSVPLFFAGCSKKPVMRIADVNSKHADISMRCMAAYASDELSGIQPAIDEMNALAKKGKKKKANEKALEILSVLQAIGEKAEGENKARIASAEHEKAAAALSLQDAAEAGAAIHAAELFKKSMEFLKKGNEAFLGKNCAYREAQDLYRRSSVESVAAKRQAIIEKERIQKEEEERRKQEERKEIILPPKESMREWIVGRGDTLWNISADEDIFGNPFLWPLIFWANRSQIKGPDTIYEGQHLKIPRNLTQEELDEALTMSKSGNLSGARHPLNRK